MHKQNLIAINDFCVNHNIEISFISSLQKTGLIEITTIKKNRYIDAGQLLQLEKFVRFYFDLDINLQGIETITHLLNRISVMQDEIFTLKNRLLLYENE